MVNDTPFSHSDKMKFIRIIFITLIAFVSLFIILFNLPINIIYHSEINSGSQFAKNILNFKSANGKLPKNNDWAILEKLNPLKPYEVFYPEYLKIDSDNFQLTYTEGFDGPYLTYDTKTKKWEKK